MTTFTPPRMPGWITGLVVFHLLLLVQRSATGQELVTVTDCHLHDWVRQPAQTGSTITFVPGPGTVPLGQGSVELYTPQGNVRFRNTAFNHVPLSDMSELQYATYIQSRSNTEDDLYMALQVDLNGDEVMDETILFNPRFQTTSWLPPSIPPQDDLADGVWQTWDALHGGWWLGPAPDPYNGGTLFSLANYVAAHPNARIINPGANGTGGIRMQAGGPAALFGPNFRGSLDDVRVGVNGTTIQYDLEHSIADAGPDKAILVGYGPTCISLSGTGQGGTSPYAYAWSAGANPSDQPLTQVCPLQSQEYQLTVTDANGCQGTDEVTVAVLDVRCGPGLEKVMVCHQGHDLCVAPAAVAAHLAHGDGLGPCSQQAMAVQDSNLPVTASNESLQTLVYPNPAGGFAMLDYFMPGPGEVAIEWINMDGQRLFIQREGWRLSGHQRTSMDLAALPNGLYYFKLTVDSPGQQWMHMGRVTVLH